LYLALKRPDLLLRAFLAGVPLKAAAGPDLIAFGISGGSLKLIVYFGRGLVVKLIVYFGRRFISSFRRGA
jgi:hypothetical protein